MVLNLLMQPSRISIQRFSDFLLFLYARLQSKEPLANAVARDDAMIAAAKLGVEKAEKKLMEEEAVHAR